MRTGVSVVVMGLLAILTSSCRGEPDGEFSPLIQPGAGGRYDLLVEGVPSVRSADLAPGAKPARPVFEERQARKVGHFVTRHSGKVEPATIGEQMLEALTKASFTEDVRHEVTTEGTSWSADATYRTADVDGTLSLNLVATDEPDRIDVKFEIEETKR